MVEYRRVTVSGGSFFFTQVTHERYPWLCTDGARQELRQAIIKVRQKLPFTIAAMVLLPDHLHCIWTLPEGDRDYTTRWRLIKTYVTKNRDNIMDTPRRLNASRQKRHEGDLWQRRFWEHTIQDEVDYQRHCDYIHYNPVKHGLCQAPRDWLYSSFHRFVQQGIYSVDWGETPISDFPIGNE